jgi:hypothetical protein
MWAMNDGGLTRTHSQLSRHSWLIDLSLNARGMRDVQHLFLSSKQGGMNRKLLRRAKCLRSTEVTKGAGTFWCLRLRFWSLAEWDRCCDDFGDGNVTESLNSRHHSVHHKSFLAFGPTQSHSQWFAIRTRLWNRSVQKEGTACETDDAHMAECRHHPIVPIVSNRRTTELTKKATYHNRIRNLLVSSACRLSNTFRCDRHGR